MKRQTRASVAVMFILVATATLWIGWHDFTAGLVVGGLGLLVCGALAWFSLRRGRHTPWEVAQPRLADGDAVILWKPGCFYCERLLRQLKAEPRCVWVNVWADPAANAVVRRFNDGNEFTPTVLIGRQVLRNPPGADVVSGLRH